MDKVFIQYILDIDFTLLHEELEGRNISIDDWIKEQYKVFEFIKRDYKNSRTGIVRYDSYPIFDKR